MGQQSENSNTPKQQTIVDAKQVARNDDQSLFVQLVVGITNGMISSGYNVSKIGPATARDIVSAARNLRDAVEELK